MNILNNIIKNLIVTLINLYRMIISPLFPDVCRFYPSCSSYALEALKKYGIFRGAFLATKRILKCHPFNHGGYNPLN